MLRPKLASNPLQSAGSCGVAAEKPVPGFAHPLLARIPRSIRHAHVLPLKNWDFVGSHAFE